ncbi:MAG: ABC transporter ATP-binding protein [Arthrobacter sp.]|uniref:dipeptide ABC transporter ATP-binding protein n=1 Tax=Arthrobacter sp. TaxID=1667 RepID=UPI00347BA81B
MTLTATAATTTATADGGGPDRAAALEIRGLGIAYGHGAHRKDVVHGVDLALAPGQTLALVGQSGSGKSTIAQAAGGLLPPNGRITDGSVRVAGREVTGLTRRGWRALRGTGVGYVPQDPLSSLDPLQTVGAQVGQALLLHTDATRRTVRARAADLLGHVGIRDPARRLEAYPHELSGGQLQRVLIASAIAGHPDLLIADEPTSALDVTVQKTILDLLGDLQRELGSAILFITHDLALATDRSETIAVLNHGRLVDAGGTRAVVRNPSDDYTRRLFADAPATAPDKYRARLAADAAATPDRRDAITVRGLVKHYGHPRAGAAVDGVGFTVRAGTTHALVGESGSGKTTVARVIAGLEPFTSGTVTVGGRGLDPVPPRANAHARQLQLVHQNPLSALDPKYSIRRSIEEPLRLHRGSDTPAERARRVRDVADRVALPKDLLERRPREVSGGQRQRVAIARALVLAPDILVLDEPTSALDVTVQARIIELLFELREEQQLTYLFISHDLGLVRQIADEVSVLEHGRLVESGPADGIFRNSSHEYTRRLIDSIPGRAAAPGPATPRKDQA